MTPIVLNDEMKKKLIEQFTKKLDSIKTIDDTIKVEQKIAMKPERNKQVIFTARAFLQMLTLVNDYDSEVAWHGTVERPDDDTFVITNILIYPQVVTGATVTTDDKEYSQWIAELPDEDFEKLRFQGHSHVKMAVTPSSVDLKQQKDILEQVDGSEYYIFMIINKYLTMNIWIYDMKSGMKYSNEDIDVILESAETMQAIEDLKDSAKDCVATYKAADTKKKTEPKKEPKKSWAEEADRYWYSDGRYSYFYS